MININIFTEAEKRPMFLHMLDLKRFPTDKYHIVENSDEDIVWDLVVVYEGIHRPHKVRYRKGKLIFISGEPPMSRTYVTDFLKQFDTLITQHPNLHHPNNVLAHPCMNWHLGLDYSDNLKSIFTFEELEAMQPMPKIKNISMITSAQRMMPGHNLRMNFVEKLISILGDEVDLFGKGIRPVNTKWEALRDYRFAICIENSNIPYYWTEKFADPILSYTVPIYFGCTNIDDYFSPKSYIPIDIRDTDSAIKKLQEILDNPEEIYQKHLPYVIEARKKIINDYCIFPTLQQTFLQGLQISNETVEVTIRPCSSYWQHKWKFYMLRLKRLMYKFRLGGQKTGSSHSLTTEKNEEKVEGILPANDVKPLLSIIIPVYNVEKYVRRCLDSVLNQNVDKTLYEVIIVNDGSTDNSLAVVNETVEGYPNVSVHTTKNRGQSAARNHGTQFVRGQYIWYIDSDDWIESGAIKALLPYMNGEYDIIQFGKSHVFADGTKKVFHRKPMLGTGKDVLLNGDWSIGAPFSIYKRQDFYNDTPFHFREGIYHEDNELVPRVLHNAKKVIVLDVPFYNHYQGNQESTMHKPNIKKCYDLLTVSKSHVEYAMKQRDKDIRCFFLTLASLELNTSLNNLYLYDKKERDKYIRMVESGKEDYVKYLFRGNKLRYRLMALCMSLTSVHTYYQLLHLRKTKHRKK